MPNRCSLAGRWSPIPLFIGSCLISLSGCGGHPSVTGSVTFPDGSPLTVGEVVLDNGSIMGRGSLDENGGFVIGFTRPGDGIPAGWYHVGIINASRAGMTDWLIDQKFLSPQTSGLRFKVSADRKNELLIVVTPPGPKKR